MLLASHSAVHNGVDLNILFDDGAAGEGVELSGHDGLHELENMVACAMAGVEMGVGVISRQSLC